MNLITSVEPSLRSDTDATPADRLAERLAREMASSWKKGQPCGAEMVLAENPELSAHPRAAVRLIYEEVCQREALGQEVPADELRARFPAFHTELDILLRCHEFLVSDTKGPRLPGPGDLLGEFRLLALLGSGALGRVFLAEQSFLADRRVVLKVTPSDGAEHISLARLQHTHIVPLYAMREFPERGLRALCMPCLGGATLDQILRRLEGLSPHERSGDDLRRAMADAVADPRMHWQGRGSSWQYLERATYVQAICWVGLCAADALHYAHSQGLLHLDLKPSNLLLTADCQPMLLDFHLARGPLVPGVGVPDRLGGTEGYMSPEQRLAFEAIQEGRTLETGVDARSDVYSLALVLAEALGGGPRGVEPDALPLDGRCLQHLPTGLRDILSRAVHADPDCRYPDAAALAEDLRRHLTDRALVGVRNRNPAERWKKWRQRSPHALSAGGLMIAVVAISTMLATVIWNNDRQRTAEAAAALNAGNERVARGEYSDAVAALSHGAGILKGTHTGSELARDLQRALRLAARGQAARALHDHADRLRFAYGNESLQPAALQALEEICRQTWTGKGSLLDTASGSLRPEDEDQLKTDLLDVAVLWTDLSTRLTEPSQVETERQEAIAVLDEAERLFGPSCVVTRQRQTLGESGSADDPEPRSAWEHYAVGRWLLKQGDFPGASSELDRSVALRPQEFWPWFWRGLCAFKGRHFEPAITSFSVCIALSPESAECYCNRALARAALSQFGEARADYDKALQLDSNLWVASLNRGVLNLQEKRLREAESDLKHALATGAEESSVYLNFALLSQARHDRAGALTSIEAALRCRPDYREARDLRSRILNSRN
jgi:serine/threonine protein kinase